MALDPRLSDPRLLALAALRLKARPPGPPMQEVTVQVVYIDALDGSVEPGEQYTYSVPVAQLREAPC